MTSPLKLVVLALGRLVVAEFCRAETYPAAASAAGEQRSRPRGGAQLVGLSSALKVELLLLFPAHPGFVQATPFYVRSGIFVKTFYLDASAVAIFISRYPAICFIASGPAIAWCFSMCATSQSATSACSLNSLLNEVRPEPLHGLHLTPSVVLPGITVAPCPPHSSQVGFRCQATHPCASS